MTPNELSDSSIMWMSHRLDTAFFVTLSLSRNGGLQLVRNCSLDPFLVRERGDHRKLKEGRMDATGPTIRFAGDLNDPLVMDLLNSISTLSGVHAVMCDGEDLDRLFEPDQPPRLLILHRSRLTQAAAARIDQWRSVIRPNVYPRVILCYGPYVRYAELERSSRGVDLFVPEATAMETLAPRHEPAAGWRRTASSSRGGRAPTGSSDQQQSRTACRTERNLPGRGFQGVARPGADGSVCRPGR